MQPLISVKLACDILNMSRATLYRRIKSGEIDPPLKDGPRSKFEIEKIVKYQRKLIDHQT